MFRQNWDANNILKLGIALSVINVSIGVTWSLITGSEFNVEAFNTKMTLSGITSKNKQLTRDLKQVSADIKGANLAPQQREKINKINLELEKTEAEIEEIEEIFTDESIKSEQQQFAPREPDKETENESN